MFGLLAPGWLLALTALSVPVLIHLWSRRERKIIKIGSTKRIEASVQQRARKLRITDWPLLILRLALLSTLVLLLAGPVWRSSRSDNEEPNRWALVSPDIPLDSSTRHLIDSLATAGDDIRVLESTFPVFDAEMPSNNDPASIWSLLKEADELLPAGSSIDVVAPPLATRFGGARPALSTRVTWHVLPATGDNHWIETARRTSGDSLRITVGISRSEETFFNTMDIPYPAETSIVAAEGMPPLEIHLGDGEEEVRLLSDDAVPGDDAGKIMARDAKHVLLFYEADRAKDARFVRAALETAAAHLDIDLMIDTTAAGDIPDIVFWLNASPVPDGVIRLVDDGATLIRDAPDTDGTPIDARIYASTPMGKDPPRLYRRVAAREEGVAEWTDDFGAVVMSRRRWGAGLLYTFYSRFDTAWSNLAFHPYWLDRVVLLLHPDETSVVRTAGISDRRRLSLAEIEPRRMNGVLSKAPAVSPLNTMCWILVVALFLVENWMNTRILNQSSSGHDEFHL